MTEQEKKAARYSYRCQRRREDMARAHSERLLLFAVVFFTLAVILKEVLI